MTSQWRTLLLAVIIMASASAAADKELIPAQFGRGEHSLPSLLACPTADADLEATLKVFCQAALTADGSVRRNGAYCFSTDDGSFAYVRAALEASDNARFEPATVDGQPVPVLINYQLLFRLQGGGCRVAAIPNHGANAGSLGLAYYAPQVIDDDEAGLWRTQLFRPTGSGGSLVSARGVAFVLSAQVDAHGRVHDARLVENNFAPRTDVRRALAKLRRARFIPGYVDGEPAAVRYVYYLYYDPDDQPDLAPQRTCC